MVFTKKSVKTKKPANAKRADRQKHAKKHRAKAVFFQVLHREGLRIVHSAFAPFGGKARFYGTLFFEILHCVQNDKWGIVFPTVGAGLRARP